MPIHVILQPNPVTGAISTVEHHDGARVETFQGELSVYAADEGDLIATYAVGCWVAAAVDGAPKVKQESGTARGRAGVIA